MIKKRAFTMAEAVIVMAIAGIFAVLSMSVVRNLMDPQKKEQPMYKKAYYTTEKIIEMLINSNDLYPTGNFMDGRDVIIDGTTYPGTHPLNKFCAAFKSMLNNAEEIDDYNLMGGCSLIDNNGFVWEIFGNAPSPSFFQVYLYDTEKNYRLDEDEMDGYLALLRIHPNGRIQFSNTEVCNNIDNADLRRCKMIRYLRTQNYIK